MPPTDDGGDQADAPSLEVMTARMAAEHGRDYYLAGLVAAANATDSSIGITLMVGGLVVSGRLQSGETWFRDRQKALQDAGLGEFSGMFDLEIAEYQQAREAAQLSLADESSDANLGGRVTVYIHLGDVTIWSADGGAIGSGEMSWRCRLVSVDGWALGQLQSS